MGICFNDIKKASMEPESLILFYGEKELNNKETLLFLDIDNLANLLSLLRNGFICPNGKKATAIETMCVFVRRHCYLCRCFDLVPQFGHSIPELCLINKKFINFIYDSWNCCFSIVNQLLLSLSNLKCF